MSSFKCKGIILKNHRLSDSDKIIHILTDEHGPRKAIAKGAYKIKSRLGAKTQVLNYCEFQLAQGRNLDIVQELSLIEQFSNIQKDYDLLSTAYFFCELTDSVSLSGDDSSKHYLELLLENLNYLNQHGIENNTELKNLILKFLWAITTSQGYKPQLSICYKTGKKRAENQVAQYFDFENGSILSEKAYFEYLKENPYETNIHVFQQGVFKILKELDIRNEFSSENSEYSESTIKFLQKHLEYCLHHEFKSWKNLQPVLEASPQGLTL